MGFHRRQAGLNNHFPARTHIINNLPGNASLMPGQWVSLSVVPNSDEEYTVIALAATNEIRIGLYNGKNPIASGDRTEVLTMGPVNFNLTGLLVNDGVSIVNTSGVFTFVKSLVAANVVAQVVVGGASGSMNLDTRRLAGFGTGTTISTIEALTDVNVSNPQNGQVLKRQGTAWFNQDNSLETLSDTQITTPGNANYLQYNSGTNTWNNQVFAEDLVNLSDVTYTGFVNNSDYLQPTIVQPAYTLGFPMESDKPASGSSFTLMSQGSATPRITRFFATHSKGTASLPPNIRFVFSDFGTNPTAVDMASSPDNNTIEVRFLIQNMNSGNIDNFLTQAAIALNLTWTFTENIDDVFTHSGASGTWFGNTSSNNLFFIFSTNLLENTPSNIATHSGIGAFSTFLGSLIWNNKSFNQSIESLNNVSDTVGTNGQVLVSDGTNYTPMTLPSAPALPVSRIFKGRFELAPFSVDVGSLPGVNNRPVPIASTNASERDVNIGGFTLDTTNGRVTIPETGVYRVSANCKMAVKNSNTFGERYTSFLSIRGVGSTNPANDFLMHYGLTNQSIQNTQDFADVSLLSSPANSIFRLNEGESIGIFVAVFDFMGTAQWQITSGNFAYQNVGGSQTQSPITNNLWSFWRRNETIVNPQTIPNTSFNIIEIEKIG